MKIAITILTIFGLAMTQCPTGDQYCGKCVSNVCVACYASYYKGNVCVASTKTVAYCAIYLADGICSGCNIGYYLDVDLTCKTIPDSKCFDYDVKSKCNYCMNGFKPANGTCSTVACSETNCAYCNSDDKCTICKSGYSLDTTSSKCVAETKPIANCLSQMSGLGCALCNYGYFDKNGTCTLSASYKSAGLVATIIAGVIGTLFL